MAPGFKKTTNYITQVTVSNTGTRIPNVIHKDQISVLTLVATNMDKNTHNVINQDDALFFQISTSYESCLKHSTKLGFKVPFLLHKHKSHLLTYRLRF